jgi:uncharacterized membrane protein
LPKGATSTRQNEGMTHKASWQAAFALIIGVVAGVVVGLAYRPSLAPLAGYDVAALVYLVRVWSTIWPLDAEGTAALAGREDPTRPAADLVLLVAAVASLGAVAVAIVQSHTSHGSVQGIEVGMGVSSVVVSWLLVHTLFTLKYARLYYGGDGDEGGVDFEHHVRPPYSDFAYLAFTIGMTFQVSDTDLQSAEYRRLALRHGLLSYLFGAVILAASINLVAGLAN